MLSAKLKTGSIKLCPSLPPPSPTATGVSSPLGSLGSLYVQEEPAPWVAGSSAQNPNSIADYLLKAVPQFPHLQSGYDLSLLHTEGTAARTALDHTSKRVSRQRTSRLCISQKMLLNSPWKSQSLRHSIHPVAQHPRNSRLVKFYCGSTENNLLSLLLPQPGG